MRKILQITDCHLVPGGERLFTLDPAARLRAAIADINTHHGDADLCVFTGDLAHSGEPDAYEVLKSMLDGLTVPYRLMPGNHDDRERLSAAFPRIEADEHGFLQSSLATPEGVFLFLDTVDAGVHSGAYCKRRCRWLDAALGDAGDRPAYLFMHHPPMAIGMPRLDQYRILDAEPLAATIERHRNIRHIFFGHVHRPIAGSWRGVPASAVAGTNHQTAFDLSEGGANIVSLSEPVYGVAIIGRDSVIVHQHAFASDADRLTYDPD